LLGGNNGLAGGVNNLGQVVGQAEYSTPDPICHPFLQIGQELRIARFRGLGMPEKAASHGG